MQSFKAGGVFFVSPRALTNMKVRLKGAQKGHSLLKKKADALSLRFRQILHKIIEVPRCFITLQNQQSNSTVDFTKS